MWDRKPPDPRFNIWFLGPMQVHPPNDISISSTVFVVLMVLNNTQTTDNSSLCMLCGTKWCNVQIQVTVQLTMMKM